MKSILLILNGVMLIYIIYLTVPILFGGVGESNYSNETEHNKGKLNIFNIYIYIYIYFIRIIYY